MLHRTKGIVLRNSPYGEADLFVTFLTSDYGLINTFAKSPRKIKSRFGSSLEPLTYSKISFWGKENANLPRLTQADIIKPFQRIRENIDAFMKVCGMLELTLRFLPEREPNKEAFSLLLETLNEIEKNTGERSLIGLTVLFYKVKFLRISGHAPGLSDCAKCRRSATPGRHGGIAPPTAITPFYISQGAVLCRECAKGLDAPIRLSAGSVSLYESMGKWEVSKLTRLKPSQEIVLELKNMLDAHIEYTLSMPLRTKGITVV